MTGGADIELLAPAGGPEAFDAALAAGADAIYVGFGNDFNARRSAANFDGAAFEAATAKAHLVGARVYVTMNVVIKDAEMPRALEQARRAWVLGADAIIVQDWGLLAELRRRWPQIECHASTQMAIMDARGCVFAKRQGVSRVTLARELSLSEIADCVASGIEVEVFAHGALCFCYSGLCQMSSLSGPRSANRGLCAQPCRLPYTLVGGDGTRVSAPGFDRPLCPRDLRSIDLLASLAEEGVSSVKIEGRMKAPEYVHAVTRAYRDALNELGASVRHDVPELSSLGRHRRDELLKRAFNRDFTDAYLFGRSGNEMMSYERSNNRGELVGTVVGARDLGSRRVPHGGRNGGRERLRTMTFAEVGISLAGSVDKGDLLELRPIDDPSQFITVTATASASAGDRMNVRAPRTVSPGSTVRVIRSQAAVDAVRRVDASHPCKRMVDLRVIARVGTPLAVTISSCDGSFRAKATGDVVEAARTRVVTADELAMHAARLGDTPFVARETHVELDAGVGLAFSSLHRVRAKAVRALMAKMLEPYANREGATARPPNSHALAMQLRRLRGGDDVARTCPVSTVEVCALVSCSQTARAAYDAGVTRVYAYEHAFDEVFAAVPRATVVPWLDEVCRVDDHARLDASMVAATTVAVGNVSELAKAVACDLEAEVRPCVPVHNSAALLALEQAGARAIWLSGELSLSEIAQLVPVARVPIGLVVHGRQRAMTSEHCVLQVRGDCAGDCASCAIRNVPHALVGTKGERHPVTTDASGRSRIWSAQVLDLIPQVGELIEIGVRRLMVDATLLSPSETAQAVRRVISAACDARRGGRRVSREAGSTSGHLFSELL